MANSYLDSDGLIASIKRKMMFPVSQNTFTNTDILQMASEEMAISQVPSVLSFHEEFFVTSTVAPLLPNQSRYAIPSRAIGMRLRSVFYKDVSGNLVEMTRVSSDDKAFFAGNQGTNQTVHKFYLEGNDVVLVPSVNSSPTGSLAFFYYIRPNQLVTTDRVATITSMFQDITLGSLVAGDAVVLNGVSFSAVVSGATGNQFVIGGTPTISATNLVAAINMAGTATASNAAGASPIVHLVFSAATFTFSTNNTATITIPTTMGMTTTNSQSSTVVPTNFTVGSNLDFLQTSAGHKIRAFSIPVTNTVISGLTFTFPIVSVPTDLVVGDYLASENECIIPMLPDDLHSGLAERTCARILAALGDQAGLTMSSAKIQEINSAQNMLLDNRTEGNPKKILGRHSILRYSKNRPFRRI